jgi:DnaJ-class molecular chaperone
MLNHYSLLRIQPGTTQNGVEEAFARFKHSIAGYAPGIEVNEPEIAQRFPEVWQAYQVLLDPLSRLEYEKILGEPVEESAATQFVESKKEDEGLLAWVTSGFAQAGFILILLSCIYALVHFAAL